MIGIFSILLITFSYFNFIQQYILGIFLLIVILIYIITNKIKEIDKWNYYINIKEIYFNIIFIILFILSLMSAGGFGFFWYKSNKDESESS